MYTCFWNVFCLKLFSMKRIFPHLLPNFQSSGTFLTEIWRCKIPGDFQYVVHETNVDIRNPSFCFDARLRYYSIQNSIQKSSYQWHQLLHQILRRSWCRILSKCPRNWISCVWKVCTTSKFDSDNVNMKIDQFSHVASLCYEGIKSKHYCLLLSANEYEVLNRVERSLDEFCINYPKRTKLDLVPFI